MTKNNEKWIDLFKWFISSVCIVTVTLIIDSGFKEREAGIKEMEVYDRYVDIILKADNIEERWKLCEYFSIVTPTERLRSRWAAYKDTISKDYWDWKSKQLSDSTLSIVVTDPNSKPLISNDNGNFSNALINESNGFKAILDKDVDLAINNFKVAEQEKNGLHNCYEIYTYLSRNRNDFIDRNSDRWTDFYRKLLKDWSWGMPEDTKKRLSEQIY